MNMITILVGVISGGRGGTRFHMQSPIRMSENCLDSTELFEAALNVFSDGEPNDDEVQDVTEECDELGIEVEFIKGQDYYSTYTLNMNVHYREMIAALKAGKTHACCDVFGEGTIAMVVEGKGDTRDLKIAAMEDFLEDGS